MSTSDIITMSSSCSLQTIGKISMRLARVRSTFSFKKELYIQDTRLGDSFEKSNILPSVDSRAASQISSLD